MKKSVRKQIMRKQEQGSWPFWLLFSYFIILISNVRLLYVLKLHFDAYKRVTYPHSFIGTEVMKWMITILKLIYGYSFFPFLHAWLIRSLLWDLNMFEIQREMVVIPQICTSLSEVHSTILFSFSCFLVHLLRTAKIINGHGNVVTCC